MASLPVGLISTQASQVWLDRLPTIDKIILPNFSLQTCNEWEAEVLHMFRRDVPNVVMAPTLEVGVDLKWARHALKDLLACATWIYDSPHVILILPTCCEPQHPFEQAKAFNMCRRLAKWAHLCEMGTTLEVYSKNVTYDTVQEEPWTTVALQFVAREIKGVYGVILPAQGGQNE
jgi:hypothetical protein